jgi:hypothetical protein
MSESAAGRRRLAVGLGAAPPPVGQHHPNAVERTLMRPGATSRRAVLAGGVAIALGACTSSATPEPPDPDVAILRDVAAGVRSLVRDYAEAARRYPELAAQLAPLAAEHVEHLRALGVPTHRPPTSTGLPESPTSTGATSTPTGSTPTSTETSGSGGLARGRAATLAVLARAEQRTAELRPGQTRRASPELARLVASIGACEAAHAALLSSGAVT